MASIKTDCIFTMQILFFTPSRHSFIVDTFKRFGFFERCTLFINKTVQTTAKREFIELHVGLMKCLSRGKNMHTDREKTLINNVRSAFTFAFT